MWFVQVVQATTGSPIDAPLQFCVTMILGSCAALYIGVFGWRSFRIAASQHFDELPMTLGALAIGGGMLGGATLLGPQFVGRVAGMAWTAIPMAGWLDTVSDVVSLHLALAPVGLACYVRARLRRRSA